MRRLPDDIRPGAPARVEVLWAIVAELDGDREALILTGQDDSGELVPMVFADPARLARAVAVARRLGRDAGCRVRVARFVRDPDPTRGRPPV